MADPDQHSKRAEVKALGWQLAGAWVCGSVLLGTVALVFLRTHAVSGGPLTPAAVSLTLLTPLERLAVFALVAALFVALGVLSWGTAPASWLSGDTRARILWALLVGAGGLAGWGFAAAVTFAANFGSGTQLILAYLAGGLPFALTAAMLVRPWRVNVAAVALSALLVGSGYLMVAGHPAFSPYPRNVFTLYIDYARSFF
jgi:hypothetical protein